MKKFKLKSGKHEIKFFDPETKDNVFIPPKLPTHKRGLHSFKCTGKTCPLCEIRHKSRKWRDNLKMEKEPKYDDYAICPNCGHHNKIFNVQYIGSSLCECKTYCFKCKHEDYWAYEFYESKSY